MIIGFTKQLLGFKLSPMLTGLSVPLTEEPQVNFVWFLVPNLMFLYAKKPEFISSRRGSFLSTPYDL